MAPAPKWKDWYQIALILQESVSFLCVYIWMCVCVFVTFFYYLLNLSLFLFGGNVEWPPGLISSREEEATTIYLMDGKQDGSAYGQTNAKTFLFFFNFYLMRGRARLDVRRRRHWHRLLVRPSIRQSVIASYLCMLFGDPIAPYQVCSRNGALTSDIEIIRKENRIRKKRGEWWRYVLYYSTHAI